MACVGAKIQESPEPNTPFTENTLKNLKINVSSLPGMYVTPSQSATFYKDSRVSQKQGVEGGILFIENLITGSSLYQPERVARKDKKGRTITRKNGQIITDPFLMQIVSATPGEGDVYLQDVQILLTSDSLADVFTYTRLPVYGDRYGSNTLNLGSGGFTPLAKKRQSSRMARKPIDYRYGIQLLAFEKGMELDSDFKVEPATNLVYFNEGGVRYYVTQGRSGSYWFIGEDSKFLYIDRFYLIEIPNNQKTQTEAISKKIGQ